MASTDEKLNFKFSFIVLTLNVNAYQGLVLHFGHAALALTALSLGRERTPRPRGLPDWPASPAPWHLKGTLKAAGPEPSPSLPPPPSGRASSAWSLIVCICSERQARPHWPLAPQECQACVLFWSRKGGGWRLCSHLGTFTIWAEMH